ncbi:MAG: hypothetical protein QM656_03355 [Paracoccaceae bacterium]
MQKRGPKSAAELEIAAKVVVVNRPEPPYELWRDEEQEVWRRVVSDVPADWFTPRNFDLLAEYCTHVVSCRRVAQMIYEFERREGELDIKSWTVLMRAHAQQSGRIQALATSMRITQQSTYSNKSGATALEGHKSGRKPWDT